MTEVQSAGSGSAGSRCPAGQRGLAIFPESGILGGGLGQLPLSLGDLQERFIVMAWDCVAAAWEGWVRVDETVPIRFSGVVSISSSGVRSDIAHESSLVRPSANGHSFRFAAPVGEPCRWEAERCGLAERSGLRGVEYIRWFDALDRANWESRKRFRA